MAPKLRWYQSQASDICDVEWDAGHVVVVVILATGAGKTVLFSHKLSKEPGACAAIAHRRELVVQMSMALARNGVRHRVVGTKKLQRQVVACHMAEFGRSYYDPNSKCGVASVYAIANMPDDDPWLLQVQMAIGDEGHHYLRENVFGKAIAKFKNVKRVLLPTATGFRADGKGLGASSDGLAHTMVLGVPMRQLIEEGYLCDYDLVAPPPPKDLDLSQVAISAGGDYNPDQLRKAVHKSKQLVGNVVETYLREAPGKLGATFCVDVEEAVKQAEAFRASGVPAEVVHGDMDDLLRVQVFKKFKARQVLQLVSVDILGEGVDVPAMEVISMARPTESKGLYDQQFGRPLRLDIDAALMARWEEFSPAERLAHIAASRKPRALIIDHVNNYTRHGLPDGQRYHTLERRDRRSKGSQLGVIPLRSCTACTKAYEKTLAKCPYCGEAPPEPTARSKPEEVEGALAKLDPAVLRAMRGEVRRVDGAPRFPSGAPDAARGAIYARHTERQQAQLPLRQAMAGWLGWQAALGRDAQKAFWYVFGLDVLTAQTLGAKDAAELMGKINNELYRCNIVVDGAVNKE
jgi:superfamily II DNA or RNA helicase